MLGQSIKAAITAASTDKTIPLLNTVQVHPTYAIATDRYRIVKSYHKNPLDLTFEPFLIPLEQAKQLTKLGTLISVTPLGNDNKPQDLLIETHDPKDGTQRVLVQPFNTESYSGYPPLQELLDDALDSTNQNPNQNLNGVTGVQLNIRYLTAWTPAKIARSPRERRQQMTLKFAEVDDTGSNRDKNDGFTTRAVVFEFSDHFQGLLLPTRS